MGKAEPAGLFEEFDGRRRFAKKSERRGGGMPHVVRMQERFGLAVQRDVHEMRGFGAFAPQSPQERLAGVKPGVVRQHILRRLNSRLGVVQLPGVKKNRGLKYVGPDVDRIVAKSALETFFGLIEIPHAQDRVSEQDVGERGVWLGCESDEQAFSGFFQHADVIENQRLPDARGMAARIETKRVAKSAQSRSILEFFRWRPKNAELRAVCLGVIG